MSVTSLVPVPDSLSAYHWRPAGMDDVQAVCAMLEAGADVDRPLSPPSTQRVSHLYGLLGERLANNTLLALAEDGSLAAQAFIFFPPDDEFRLALLDGHVHLRHRGLGLGSYLMRWLEERARQEFSGAGEGLPQLLRLSCAAHQADRIDLFKSCGFEEARYSYTMQRSLEGALPEHGMPEGVLLSPWSPGLDQAAMGAFNLAFHGLWGVPSMTPGLWSEFFTGVPQFRPDLSGVALAGEEVVGFCINWVTEGRGWIEALGVIPAWRGRGLAKALLAHSLRMFQQAGLEQSALDVDAENPTGALRLYQKLGFSALREQIHFVKNLITP